MGTADRFQRHYEFIDESARLWGSPLGDLTRLRTWDIFDRFLPPRGRVADVGGGPGTHAAHLASRGFDVTLIDPVTRHVDHAREVAAGTFECLVGDARELPFATESMDVVLLMGPMYHLVDPAERAIALREAHRVLRPGGRLLAEVIPRYAWIIDATYKGLLSEPGVFESFETNLRTGLSNDPDKAPEHVFWAYFHEIEEIAPEIERAQFGSVQLVAVEGFAGHVANLDRLLEAPEELLRALRLVESEPSLLGASGHVMAIANRAA